MKENKKVNFSEKAYLALKEDIFSGAIKPGEELIESKIAQNLGISRTPLREALNKLQAEGLVDTIPNKGCIVKGLDIREIIEITQMREALEGMVARLACEKIKQEDVEELAACFPSFEGKLDEKDYQTSYEAGIKLHAFLMQQANNRLISQQLDFIRMQIKRTVQLSTEIPGRFEKAHKEHGEIIKALLVKDPDLAEKKMREHIANTRMGLVIEVAGRK